MKFIAIAVGQQESAYDVYALAEDGSVWVLTYRALGYGWYRVSPKVEDGAPNFFQAPDPDGVL